MRSLLLALIALACIAPAAEASTRDQRASPVASSPAPQAQRSAQPASRQARTAPTSAGRTSAQARPRQAAAQPVRQRGSNLRPGDVRTSSGGVLVRGASAATVSREAPTARAPRTSSRNAVATCTRRNGRAACAPARSSVAGWQAGLPRADYAQRDCPDGTLATLARGHEDVVRCMPF